MPDPAQNSGETVPGRPFPPGQSANPGGRPKGIARRCRELVGQDGDLLLQFLVTAMSGTLPRQVVAPDGSTTTIMEEVSNADRIAAVKILLDRGFGKPPAFAPIEEGDPLDLAERTAEEVAARFDRRLDELAARRAQTAGAPARPAKRRPAARRPRKAS